MGLDKATRNCQEPETYDDCKTWLHVDNLRKKCGCLPLTLRLSEKVKVQKPKKFHENSNLMTKADKNIPHSQCCNLYLQDDLCMTSKEIDCSENLTTPNPANCIR